MDLVRSVDGTTTVLEVAGDIEVLTAAELQDAVKHELAQSGCSTLVLDLSRVEFMDSTGLGALLSIRSAAATAEKALVLRAPSASVFFVMDLAALRTEFVVEPE